MNNQKTNNPNPCRVKTGEVRLSYCYIAKPRPSDKEDGTPDYSTAILIKKTDTFTLEAVKAGIKAALEKGITEKWGGRKPANLSNPLRDGDTESDEEAYAGHFFMNAKSKTQPGVVFQNKGEITGYDIAEKVYSGVYARVSVTFFPYDRNGNRGVACGLNNIQVLREGENLGGRVSAMNDFDDDFVMDFDDIENEVEARKAEEAKKANPTKPEGQKPGNEWF